MADKTHVTPRGVTTHLVMMAIETHGDGKEIEIDGVSVCGLAFGDPEPEPGAGEVLTYRGKHLKNFLSGVLPGRAPVVVMYGGRQQLSALREKTGLARLAHYINLKDLAKELGRGRSLDQIEAALGLAPKARKEARPKGNIFRELAEESDGEPGPDGSPEPTIERVRRIVQNMVAWAPPAVWDVVECACTRPICPYREWFH